MKAWERERRLLERLQEQGSRALTEACALTGASVATTRRDFELLQEKGLAQRTHGGLQLPKKEEPKGYLQGTAILNHTDEEKYRIAQEAAASVKAGESVFLGAGKTCKDGPEIGGNIIPFISGEEAKSEKEPLKVFGHVDEAKGEIVPFDGPLRITSQCIRVPVLNGHTATVFINFGKNPTKDELIDRLVNYTSKAAKLGLPHAPKHFIQYLTEDDRPQVLKDVDYEGGMGVSIGRLREDSIFDWKFVGLAHNTLRGAAGGALESAEMLKALGYITKK